MFDQTSFIRQLLPPHRRNPLTIALAQVLFGPSRLIMDDVVTSRTRLTDSIRTTGQTIVLEDLLTRTVSGVTDSVVYIAEGIDPNVDFTVIVPSAVPKALYGTLSVLIDRYKQAGKRYKLTAGFEYSNNNNSVGLAWERGYPYAKDNSLFIAINKVGTFYVKVVDQNGKVYSDGSVPYGLGTITQVSPIDPTLTYTVSVGAITASVTPASSYLTAQAGYDWNVGNNRTLFLGFNASEAPVVVLTKPDGSTVTQTASSFGVTFDGTKYAYRINYSGLASGRYLVAVTLKDFSYAGYVTLTDSNSGQGSVINGVPPKNNQAPIINRQVARQTAKVGTAFSQIIPADTFADNDGVVSSVSLVGLPAGLSSQTNGLVITLTGTPTSAGDSTVRVTATDDKGATVLMQYVITVTAASLPPVPPGPGLPTLQGILKTDLRPQDYGLLNVIVSSYDQATGRVYLKDDTTRNPDPGKVWLYHIQGKWYTRSQFEAAGWPPFFPILVYKYGIDTNKRRDLWREQPTTNDAQKVRYI